MLKIILTLIFAIFCHSSSAMEKRPLDHYQCFEDENLFTTNDPNDDTHLYIEDLFWASSSEESSDMQVELKGQNVSLSKKRKADELLVEKSQKKSKLDDFIKRYNEFEDELQKTGELEIWEENPEDELDVLVQVIKNNPSIKSLKGSWTKTNDRIFEVVCIRLNELREISIDCTDIRVWPKWKRDELKILINSNPRLQSLDLTKFDFLYPAINSILEHSKLEALELWSCSMASLGLDLVVKNIDTNNKLRVLAIYDCELTAPQVEKITGALKNNIILEKLIINYGLSENEASNMIASDAVIKALAQMLIHNKKIQYLSVNTDGGHNCHDIPGHLLQAFVTALETNRTLLKLSGIGALDENGLHLVKSIKDSLKRNRFLSEKCEKIFLFKEILERQGHWLPQELITFVFALVIDSNVPTLSKIKKRQAREKLWSEMPFRLYKASDSFQ